MKTMSVDLYNNFYEEYDNLDSEYPKIVGWISPEDGERRQRIIRNKKESDEFFDWFLHKFPEIKYSID